MSRARHLTRLYLVDHRAADRHADHGVLQRRDDPPLVLAQRLQRSGAQRLAGDHGQSAVELLQDVSVSSDALRQRLLATMPRPVDRQRAVVDEQIHQAHDRISDLQSQLAAGQQDLAGLQRGADRVTRRNQINQVTATLGRQRGDLSAWQQQLQRLEAEQAELDQADRQRDQWAQQHAGDLTAYADSIRNAQAAARRQATLRELTTAPQTRPNHPTNRTRWRRDLTDPRDQTRDHEPTIDIDIA